MNKVRRINDVCGCDFKGGTLARTGRKVNAATAGGPYNMEEEVW
jgi:hypothetical protein